MDCIKFKEKHLLTITILIAVLAICAGILAYKNYKDYEIFKNNKYNMAFFEVVDYMENVETYLAKAAVTKEAAPSAENLIQVWRQTNLAGAYLSQIPVSTEGLSNTQKFINQTSEYTHYLFRKNMQGTDLTDDELNKLEELQDYSQEVKNTLNQLSEDVNANRLNWNELEDNASIMFSKDVSNISKDGFKAIEETFEQYDGLIYDGAYSEHITSKTKKGLTGNDIDEEKAKQIVTDFVGNDKIETINSEGVSENGTIECYTFTVILKNNSGSPMTIAISRKGGHIVFTDYNRNVEEEMITEDKADELSKNFLNSKGFTDLEKTYYTKQSGIMTINYAYKQGDVIVYSDLIKIKVALDNGDILGIETTGYLNNHEKRKLDTKNIISKEKAKENLNKKLEIGAERLAVIPTEYETEIFCWEIKGKINDKEFLIYVNSKTGKIENVLAITNTDNGILTM